MQNNITGVVHKFSVKPFYSDSIKNTLISKCSSHTRD